MQYRLVTDGQTDGHAMKANTALAQLRVGNKKVKPTDPSQNVGGLLIFITL